METKVESIAATLATLQTGTIKDVLAMNKAFRANLERYLASMLQAKKMLSLGILTSEEYAKIDTIIADKYSISSCSIYRGIDLIYRASNGNMSHDEGVT